MMYDCVIKLILGLVLLVMEWNIKAECNIRFLLFRSGKTNESIQTG